ncbi:hypothetical protein DN549_34535, partial [Burkholderia multivorans]
MVAHEVAGGPDPPPLDWARRRARALSRDVGALQRRTRERADVTTDTAVHGRREGREEAAAGEQTRVHLRGGRHSRHHPVGVPRPGQRPSRARRGRRLD